MLQPEWIVRTRHPREHILYAMGMKRSFDLVGDAQHLIFELLLDWAFGMRDNACVEFLARLNSAGRDMAFAKLNETTVCPDRLNSDFPPALWNTQVERMCWLFNCCHVCGGPAHLYKSNMGNPQTGEVYTINACFLCVDQMLEMATKRVQVRILTTGHTRYETYMSVVASPPTKNRLIELGGVDLSCVFDTWRLGPNVKHNQRIAHFERGDDCKMSKTLQSHSATTLYKEEIDLQRAHEVMMVQRLADLSNATDDVGFPTSIEGFQQPGTIWNDIDGHVLTCIALARPHNNHNDYIRETFLKIAVSACKNAVDLIQGLRSKAAATEINYVCDEQQQKTFVRMATKCAFSVQVVAVQEWIHPNQATHPPIRVVQCVLITSAPVTRDGRAWPLRPVHTNVFMRQPDFVKAFPGVEPVPGKAAPVSILSEQIQWEPIMCSSLGRGFLVQMADSLDRAPSKAALDRGVKQQVNLKCSHSYKSPRRFYMLHSCSSSSCSRCCVLGL